MTNTHIVKYDSHPAFQFVMPVWSVSEANLSAFETYYLFCKDNGLFLSSKEKKHLRKECSESFDIIFRELQSQADDEHCQCFLNELYDHSFSLLVNDLNFYLRRIDNYGHLLDIECKDVARNANQLSQHQYLIGQLNTDVVLELRELSQPTIETFRNLAQRGKLTREDLSINSGKEVSALVKILNKAFECQGINDAMSVYMRQPMQVAGLAVELSVPAASWWRNGYAELSIPPKTLYFHTDESLSVPKAIVYLSDVTAIQGATGFVEGELEAFSPNPLQSLVGRVIASIGRSSESPLSQTYTHRYHQVFGCPKFREDFMRLPKTMRFNSHFGWDILPESNLESLLTDAEKKMIGPAGTFIAFDGSRLIHRGGLVESGERVVMQVVFARKPKFLTRARRKAKRISKALLPRSK